MKEVKQDLDLVSQSDLALKLIIDASPVGIVAFDSDACIFYVNPIAAKLFGKSTALASGLKCGDLLGCAILHDKPRDGDHSSGCSECPLCHAVCSAISGEKNGAIPEGETLMKRGAGLSNIWVKFKVSGLMMRGSIGAVVTFDDITDRKIGEEKLRKSEERFRRICETANNGVKELDSESRYKFVNESFSEMLGYHVQDLTGKSAYKYIYHEDIEKYSMQRSKRIAGKKDIYELRMVHKDGSVVWTNVAETPIINTKGQFEGSFAIVTNITGSKQVEEALRHSEAFIKSVMDNLPIGIAVNTVESRPAFDYMNKNFAKYYRTTRKALSGPDAFWDVVYQDPEFREKIKNRVIEDCASGDPERMYWEDVPITRKGEGTFFINAKNIPVPDRGLMISTVWDVTDRKLAEEALKANYTLLGIAGKTAKFGGWSLDIAESKVQWSDLVANIHGMPPGYSPLLKEAIRFYTPEWREKITRVFKDCVEKGIPYDEEMEILTSDGNRVWIRTTGEAVRDDNGNIIKVQGSFQDITSRKQSEGELKKRELLLNKIFDVLPIGLWFADNKGNILRGNPAGIKIWGAEPTVRMEEYGVFKARRIPEGKEITTEDWALVHTIKSGVTIKNELLEIDAFDGKKRLILNYTAPVLDDDGSLLGAIVMNNDVTEQKLAEKALKDSEEKYRRITENISDVVWISDLKLQNVYVSPSVEKLFGEPVSEYLNKPLEERFPPDSLNIIYSTFAEELEKEKDPISDKGRTRLVEVEHYKAGGDTVWVSMNVTFIRDEKGNAIRIQGVTRDITERKRMEEELRESESRFRLFAELAPVGIVISDHEENIIYVSQKFVDLFGYTLGEMQSMEHWWSLAYPDKNLRNRVRQKWKEALVEARRAGSEIKPMEFPVTCKNRSVRQIEFRMATTGKLNIVVLTDITDRKALEGQLVQAQKMESVGRLAGGVAHDFNNMLVVIIGYAELAMENISMDDPLYNFFDEILNAARRSADITRQLLAFARKQTINPKVLDLNETVESMLKMLRRLIGEDINLAWLPESQLWPIKIDPAQVDQILANLCVNARDAISGIGKVTIETENVTLDKNYCTRYAEIMPGEYVLLAVSDNGKGMDNQTIDNIFEPFFTTKQMGQGTGLGLPTVYGIIKQNKGFVNVYSEPGKGTTFKIYLPRHKGKADRINTKDYETIPRGHGEIVLLVEDEPSILKMSRMMLENLGYSVLAANSPIEAMRLAEENSCAIHLLITDVVMPEMNGRDLANQLLKVYPDIKTLFMSGYTANVIAHHGVLDKGVHFIQKPFSKKDIGIKMRKVFEHS